MTTTCATTMDIKKLVRQYVLLKPSQKKKDEFSDHSIQLAQQVRIS
jgi:uncharacterized protein YrzB (UPF0473 family)